MLSHQVKLRSSWSQEVVSKLNAKSCEPAEASCSARISRDRPPPLWHVPSRIVRWGLRDVLNELKRWIWLDQESLLTSFNMTIGFLDLLRELILESIKTSLCSRRFSPRVPALASSMRNVPRRTFYVAVSHGNQLIIIVSFTQFVIHCEDFERKASKDASSKAKAWQMQLKVK